MITFISVFECLCFIQWVSEKHASRSLRGFQSNRLHLNRDEKFQFISSNVCQQFGWKFFIFSDRKFSLVSHLFTCHFTFEGERMKDESITPGTKVYGLVSWWCFIVHVNNLSSLYVALKHNTEQDAPHMNFELEQIDTNNSETWHSRLERNRIHDSLLASGRSVKFRLATKLTLKMSFSSSDVLCFLRFHAIIIY